MNNYKEREITHLEEYENLQGWGVEGVEVFILQSDEEGFNFTKKEIEDLGINYNDLISDPQNYVLAEDWNGFETVYYIKK